MTKRTKEILDKLDEVYTREYKCYLNHENPGQLLIATMLSAQCTDARVNIVTKDLFVKYPDMQAFAKADLKELEQDIKPTGFYHNKAKNVIGCAQRICQVYGGEVPRSLEDLVSLPGVGRKTANVVSSIAFNRPAIAVDTHVFRVSNRLKLAVGNTPDEVEKGLQKAIPMEKWSDAHHWLIWHGRKLCRARNPLCGDCPLKDICPSALLQA